MIKEKIKKSFSALLTNSKESKEFSSMVEVLGNDKYLKKERIIEICINYNVMVEKVYEKLALGYMLGEVNNESQSMLIENYQNEVEDLHNHMDKVHPNSKGIKTMKGQDFNDYVKILERHETEIIEFIKSKE